MPDKIKIMLAEDEPSLALIIKESLETRGFEVITAGDGEEAYRAYISEKPKLLVLDVMMPVKDGFTVAQEIRKNDKRIPIIFLTAKSQTQDVVDGFKHGGNDYLKKPFSMEELIVRIHALLDRTEIKNDDEGLTNIGDFVFDYTKQSLTYNKESEVLTYREAEVLSHLYRNKNEMVTRSHILKEIWGDDDFFNGRSLDVFITKLRKKLDKDKNVQIINSRGYGYKLIC
ncbi:response regulator transcription factor [Flavobacterium hauense]